MLERRKRSLSRAKAIILCFCFVVVLVILVQILSMIQTKSCLQKERGGSFSSENRFLGQLWSQIDIDGDCVGPNFSSLTYLTNEEFLLSMNCTNDAYYSFTFTNNPSLQQKYTETVSISTIPSHSQTPREFIRAICSSVTHFPSDTPWTNVYAMV